MISPPQTVFKPIGRAVLPMMAIAFTQCCWLYDAIVESNPAASTEQVQMISTDMAALAQTQTALAAPISREDAIASARAEAALGIAPPPAAPQIIEPPAAAPQAVAPTAPASSPPVITKVDFLKGIPANGTKFMGWVSFRDPDGDVNLMTLDVVSSVSMKGSQNDPNHSLQGSPTEGRYAMECWCYRKQEVTMRVTLFDAAGNSSNSMDFSFECY
jgi:hypothetical protein